MTDNDDLMHQVEELKLITCSLLPDEIFAFISPNPDENDIWLDLIHDVKILDDVLSSIHDDSLPQASFHLKVEGCKIWFEVTFPVDYNGTDISDTRQTPVISIQGDVSRTDQELWNTIVRDTLVEVGATEYEDFSQRFCSLNPDHTELKLGSLGILCISSWSIISSRYSMKRHPSPNRKNCSTPTSRRGNGQADHSTPCSLPITSSRRPSGDSCSNGLHRYLSQALLRLDTRE
jgi:hypothetical protein